MRLQAIHYGDQFAFLQALDGERAWMACAEALGHPGSSGRVSQLLIRAIASIDVPFTPSVLASSLDAVLRDGQPGRPPQVSFACVMLERRRASLCLAGLFRAHLIRGGQVALATRHQIWSEEPPRDPAVTDELVRLHPRTPSRLLGSTPTDPPASETWSLERDDEIVICSEEFHEYGSPDEYWEALRTHLRDGGVPARYATGLAFSLSDS